MPIFIFFGSVHEIRWKILERDPGTKAFNGAPRTGSEITGKK